MDTLYETDTLIQNNTLLNQGLYWVKVKVIA